MLISTKGRYALRVMLELAQGEPGECMPLPVIAQRQGISEKYLESIIAVLARAGLVEGQRGKGGGYRLSRELKDYSVGEIVRLTEGSLAPVSCLEGENTCPRADKCLSLPVWEKLDTLINDYLDSVSLADLLAEGGGNGCGIKRKTQCARDGNRHRAFTENAGKRGRNHSLRRRACARKSDGRRKGGHRALLNKTGGG